MPARVVLLKVLPKWQCNLQCEVTSQHSCKHAAPKHHNVCVSESGDSDISQTYFSFRILSRDCCMLVVMAELFNCVISFPV